MCGLYSVWLRLWGAKIGKRILWTAQTVILDRPNIEVGDNCFIGALTEVGPGCVIKDGTKLPVKTVLKVNKKIGPEDLDQKDTDLVDQFMR